MAALHRIQWIDAEIRANRYPNARRLADQFEISHRQAQRDFEYLRDSLGAPLEYSAVRRGYRYDGEAYVLPGPFVTPMQRGLLGNLAEYYARSAADHADQILDGMASLFARLSGGRGRPFPRAGDAAPAVGLGMPFLARLRLVERGHFVHRVPSALAPYYRGGDGDEGIVCEFHDPDRFLAALLAAGQPYRIAHPSWLRERVLARLDAVRKPNVAATRCVVPASVASEHRSVEEAMTSARTDARMEMTWTSFVGATQGVLKAAGLIEPDMDTSTLMGLSGRAFHLTMDERCWTGSPTMYDWPREHAAAFERLGVLAEVFQAMPDSPTFDAARRRAVTHIRAALDRGVAVVIWGVDVPEFGVVYGYDDADGVFLVDGVGKHNPGGSAPILYENVGRSCDVPELHYVIPVERVAWDAATAHRAALQDYVERIEVRPRLVPKYPSGLRAYDNWVRALESGTFEQFGVRYNTAVLSDARAHAATYLERLAADGLGLAGLADVAGAARENAAVYSRMRDALEMWRPEQLGDPVTPAQAKALVPLVRQARAIEARQLELTKRALSP